MYTVHVYFIFPPRAIFANAYGFLFIIIFYCNEEIGVNNYVFLKKKNKTQFIFV